MCLHCGYFVGTRADGAGSGAAARVPGANGAGSKTGAEPAPRIGLLRCSGGAGSGPKMEPAPFTAKPAPFKAEPAPSVR